MGYPCALSRSILQSYPVGGIDTLPRSFLCIKFEAVADFLSKSFLEKGGEREKSAGILCKLNRVAFHVTRSTRVT